MLFKLVFVVLLYVEHVVSHRWHALLASTHERVVAPAWVQLRRRVKPVISRVLSWLEVIHIESLSRNIQHIVFVIIRTHMVIRVTSQHRVWFFLLMLLWRNRVLDGLRAYTYARFVLDFHWDGFLVVGDHDRWVGRIFGFGGGLFCLCGFTVHVAVMCSATRDQLLLLFHLLIDGSTEWVVTSGDASPSSLGAGYEVSSSSWLYISTSRHSISKPLRIEPTGSVMHVLDDLDIRPLTYEIWLIFIFLFIILFFLIYNCHLIEVVMC